MMNRLLVAPAGFLMMLTVSTAAAQWTVTNLHPAMATSSQAMAVSGGQQVGFVRLGDPQPKAALWNGSAASWVDLHPADAVLSLAQGVHQGVVVGHSRFGNSVQAGRWTTGTATSWSALSPGRTATGVFDDQIAGVQASPDRALLWNTTLGTWEYLHPPGTFDSYVTATQGTAQVGHGRVSSGAGMRAYLWHGSAASVVDLTPAGAVHAWAYGMSDAQQVGAVNFGGGSEAGYWTGSAASWVSLAPAAASNSWAADAAGGYQVGSAYITPPSGWGTMQVAALWNGTPESFVDLHSFLPSGYAASRALGIDVVGPDIWVVGWAHNSALNREEAILWHHVVPEPSSLLALVAGVPLLLLRRRRRLR